MRLDKSVTKNTILFMLLALLFSALISGCLPQGTREQTPPPVVTSEPAVATPFVEFTSSQETEIQELIAGLDAVDTVTQDQAIDALVKMGPTAVDPLIDALKDRNLYLRKGAALALGQIKDPRAVDPLIAVLEDESSSVRRNAAQALGEIGDPLAVDPLLNVFQDDEDSQVRQKAAEALGKIDDVRAVEPLIAALQDTDPFIPREAALALGKIGDARAVDPLIEAYKANAIYGDDLKQVLIMIGAPSVDALIAVLKDGDTEIQYLAVEALGEIGDERAVGPLIIYMKDENTDDLITVKTSLVMIGELSVEPLIALLSDEALQSQSDTLQATEVKAYAVQALGELKDTRAVEPLISVLADEHFYYRDWAATALGEIGDARAIAPLIASMKGYERATQDAAKNALVKIGDPAVEPLIAALENEDPGIRLWAVTALGEIKDSRSVEPLIVKLNDGDYYVRQQVPQALANLNDPRVVEPLIASLHDEWSGIRMVVADALGTVKDPRAVEPLISALKDEDPYVRRQVALAIGVIQDVRGVEPLIGALVDEDPIVQVAAAEALSGFNDPRAIETLSKALQEEKISVIAGAYAYFIRLGIGGSEALLTEALNQFGTIRMAEDFLNCGNKLLEEGARAWAESKGYTIYSGTVESNRPLWGSSH
jgi:HEAT repeat protein